MQTGTERILVADDQPFVRTVVERVLSRAGYVVTTVEDGHATVAHVEDEPVDLVILDANDFTGKPVATIALPQRVPFGFHGSWLPERTP